MKKRIASVLLLVFVMLAVIGVLVACNEGDTRSDAAPEPTPADYFTFEPNSARDGYILTGTQKILPSDVIIPAEYMGMPVTEIGESAFEGCTEIESVVFYKDTVKGVGGRAFAGCSAMTSISLTEGLSVISYEVFLNCTALQQVALPDTLEFLGDGAFAGCAALESITIPSSVKVLYDYIFKDCVRLKKVALQNGLEGIYGRAFWGCEALESISFPQTVRLISGGTGDFALGSTAQEIITVIEDVLKDLIESGAHVPQVWCSSVDQTTDPINDAGFYSIINGCSSLKTIALPSQAKLTVGCFAGGKDLTISLY